MKKVKYMVYLTENKINGKKYIGVHKYKSLKDGYLGSGVALLKAIKRYGRKNFKRTVLFKFDNEKDAYTKEAELVTIDIVNDPNYYNMALGGDVGGTKPPPFQGIKVTAIHIKTMEVLTFNSIEKCGRQLNIHGSVIGKICNPSNRRKQAKGWTFRNERYGDFPINTNIKIGRPKKNRSCPPPEEE